MDPRTQLNQFCQRFCQRPVTKTDIVYVTSRYQAIVKLNCMHGEEFAGALSPNATEAEKSAAVQALSAQAEGTTSLPSAPKPKPPEDGENPAITPKTKLNSLCMRIAKRYLQKGETVYDCRTVPGGYQATVKLSALPGLWKDCSWAGQVFATKQKAEQSAAETALTSILEDKELSEEAAMPKGSGKGRGKGKDPGKGRGHAAKGWAWSEGWGWESGWTWQNERSGPNLPRERVTGEKVTGEVLEWRGTYGWIRPLGSIEHPAAQRRGSRVYAHRRDLLGDLAALAQGVRVDFHVYEDPSGLGAEEVEAN